MCESLRSQHRSGDERLLIEAVDTVTGRGEPLSDAFRSLPARVVPPFHAMVVAAAEESGDVPRELRRLAALDESQNRSREELLASCWYPLAIFHFAVLSVAAIPGPGTGAGTVLAYALITATVDGALLLLWRGALSDNRSGFLAGVFASTPVFHRMIRDAEYDGFLRVLGHLYEAGVPVHIAARRACETLSDESFSHRLSQAISNLDDGHSMAETLPRMPSIRPEIAATLATSEPAGELGSGLLRAADLSREFADRRRRQVIATIGRVLYFGAALLVAHRAISFYTNAFRGLG